MKVITSYICDICGTSYRTAEGAAECEARGVPVPLPVGLLIVDPPDGFYAQCAFAASAKQRIEGHRRLVSMWACRDNIAGDGDEQLCSSGHHVEPDEFDLAWLNRPPVQRLIAFLEKKSIEPTVWIGGRAVRLRDAAPPPGESQAPAATGQADGGKP